MKFILEAALTQATVRGTWNTVCKVGEATHRRPRRAGPVSVKGPLPADPHTREADSWSAGPVGTGLPPWPRAPCRGPADVALRGAPGADVPPQRREALRQGVEGGRPQASPAPSQPRGLSSLTFSHAQAGPGPALARLVPAEVISGVPKPLRSAEWVTQPGTDGSHPADG